MSRDVKWHGLLPQQVDIDLKTHDKHSISRLKLESLQGVEELTSWKSISDYWPAQPPSDHLHITVKVPATGE